MIIEYNLKIKDGILVCIKKVVFFDSINVKKKKGKVSKRKLKSYMRNEYIMIKLINY